MEFYTKEKKEILKHEVENAIKNLSKCIAFEAGLGIDSRTDNELERLLEEYLRFSVRLKKLREFINISIDSDLSANIPEDDYFLVKRWSGFNMEFYKTYRLNRGEYQWFHE